MEIGIISPSLMVGLWIGMCIPLSTHLCKDSPESGKVQEVLAFCDFRFQRVIMGGL